MINSFLRSLENPKRPLLGPNYWIMRQIGLILPENVPGKVAYIMIHQLFVIFVFTQYVEVYVVRSDLNLVLTNLKDSVMSIACIVKANTFLIWQQQWHQLLNYVTEADQYERETKEGLRGKILDSYTRYCRKSTYYYWSLLFTTMLAHFLTPLINVMSADFCEGLRNGTELFPHIVSSWMPFDKYQSPGSWITVIIHILIGIYAAMMMSAYDTTIMVIMVFFGGKIDILRERCKDILGKNDIIIIDREAFENVRHIHNYYNQMMKNAKLFDSLLSPVMCVYVILCSLMLCASAYQITMATNTTEVMFLAVYLIFGIAQLFLFCWHSNDVLSKIDNLTLGIYESQWWAANVKQRKNILLLGGMMKPVLIFSAGPFTMLTIPTFITILKWAYSYYTFLRK